MGHITKILVPVDGSPASIAALEQALILAEDLNAELAALQITGANTFEVGTATPTAKEAGEEAARRSEAALAMAKSRLSNRLAVRTESGDPARQILSIASSEHADLIVMGTHGRIGRLHALVGSVAESVVRNASCPVMTVREPDGEEESFPERIHGREGIASQTRRPS